MTALLLSHDLMFSSQLAGAAVQAGGKLTTAGDVDTLARQAMGENGALIFLDLSTPGIDVAGVVGRLRGEVPGIRAIIAFGPHVHAERLTAAREAGCDEVLSRGGLHGHMQAIFRRYARS